MVLPAPSVYHLDLTVNEGKTNNVSCVHNTAEVLVEKIFSNLNFLGFFVLELEA